MIYNTYGEKVTYFADQITGNVGIGTVLPDGKLTIVGDNNQSQLIIQANNIQTSNNPLILLKDSLGSALSSIHSDHISNLFVGLEAGKNNTVGVDLEGQWNTFIGRRAGYLCADAESSTAVGYMALRDNISGYGNTAVGSRALISCTGVYNTAVGTNSLYSNTTGESNTAVGYKTLSSNVTGIKNTASGMYALRDNTASCNTSFGYSAALLNTTGTGNTASGYTALRSNTTGS